MARVGIVAIGTYLPPEVRRFDWWPAELVRAWTPATPSHAGDAPAATTPLMAQVLAGMREQAADPARGVVERHVMPEGMVSTDMEVAAAERALERAGIARETIDVLLVHTAVPDYLLANTAAALHHRLRLSPGCLSLEAQASANSFLAQLALVEPMIATGRARHCLLVQSSAPSRLLDPADPVSATFGDAAAAVVVGPVPDERGILATVHRTDGRTPNTLVASPRAGRWYDGRSVLHVADPAAERQLFLGAVERAVDVIRAALDAGGHRADEVDFFASHQGRPWLRRLTQEHAGLSRARSVDIYARTAYTFAASVPLVLDTAVQERQLAAGDLVVLFGGGTGITLSAALLRWGDAR